MQLTLDVCSPPWSQLRHGPWSRRIFARTRAMTSFRVFMVSSSWRSGWTTAASSGYLFSNFFEEFPGSPKIQAVFLQLSNEQRDADLDRPTPCRHIQERGSTRSDFRPVFSQPATLQSVVELDRLTPSGINTVRTETPRNLPRQRTETWNRCFA